jgi:fructose-bisphosphate aldolase class II
MAGAVFPMMISGQRSGWGISKINIFTDIDKAAAKGARSALEAGSNTLTGMIPYEITEVKKVVKNKMELFDSIGKA